MATHSRILAWEIPWTEESGRLQFIGLQKVGHDLATKQQQFKMHHKFFFFFFFCETGQIKGQPPFVRQSSSLWLIISCFLFSISRTIFIFF